MIQFRRSLMAFMVLLTASMPAQDAPHNVSAEAIRDNGGYVDPQMWGAQADYRPLGSLAIAGGSNQLTGPSGTFSSGDVGKTVFVAGAGSEGFHRWLISTIAAVKSSTLATLQGSAVTNIQSATGGVGSDNRNSLQECWNFASKNGFTCRMPGGHYLYLGTSLVLKPHLSVEGVAPEKTILVCGPNVQNCVTLDSGPIQFVTLSNFDLDGVDGHLPAPEHDAQAQQGFHLVANGSSNAGGGIWQSTFSHIQVSNFWGEGLWLQGGTSDGMHPNQFLTFNDLELQSAAFERTTKPPVDSYRIQTVGQNEQIIFTGGQIHGTGGSQLGNGVYLNGSGTVQFNGTTCEWLDRCLVLRGTSNVSFRNGWIENVKQIATAMDNRVRGVYIDHNYIANSCYNLSDHSGYCMSLPQGASSFGSFSKNVIAWSTKPDKILDTASSNIDYSQNFTASGLQQAASAAVSGSHGSMELRVAHVAVPSIAAGSSVHVSLTWQAQPFADTDYTPVCSLAGADSGLDVVGVGDLLPKSVTALITNAGPAPASKGNLNCIAVHN